MKTLQKRRMKDVLGRIPLAPEMEWFIRRRGKPVSGFQLKKLSKALPEWKAQTTNSTFRNQSGLKVFLFAGTHRWIQHSACMSFALSGLGHKVTLGYLPFGDWFRRISEYDLRIQSLYSKRILGRMKPLVEILPLLDIRPSTSLPEELEALIKEVSIRDCQYTQQVEVVDFNSTLFTLRMKRNRFAARVGFEWMVNQKPDVVIIPNGLILEFGALFETARYLGIPAVSYEFGEQRDRIWLSLNTPVMFQDTAGMWEGRKDKPLTKDQLQKVSALFASRQGAGLWRNFARRWQEVPAEGEEVVRAKLGLDSRPVVVLAANVIGDSLTLGRQVFSSNMTEWVRRTLNYFSNKEEVQFLLRIHPGERYVDGPSVIDIVKELLPILPKHIHIIPADASVNTYDLIAIAGLGLTYTTTVGMEMAMSGVPAIVVGNTHYRCRGFTLDPNTWDEYFTILDTALDDFAKVKLSEDQMRAAWQYAYRFYFDYPQPFPWHLRDFWKDVEAKPLRKVLSIKGQKVYGETFRFLVGKPVEWSVSE